jgi:spore germination protein YaaH
VWVWVGHVWTDRVELVLEHYGDRITDVSIFGWRVDAAGNLTQTFDPTLLDPYRAKWPHLRFWLGFRNDGIASIFTGLRTSAAARAQLVADLGEVLDAHPWLHGIDIDLEQGGGIANAAGNEVIFQQVADLAHGRSLQCAAALPPLTVLGSVGGENWCRYAQLGQILDHVEIMSYDFAWRGSAPGPISPGFWLESVYDYAVTQMPPEQICMGLPLYAGFWEIHDYPPDPPGWRGDTGPYYAVAGFFTGYLAADGTFANPGGSGNFDKIGWIAYRDHSSWCAWGFLGCYDWRESRDWEAASGVSIDSYEGRSFIVRYGLPAAATLWNVVDNRPNGAYASYDIEPRRVPRATDGALVGPKNGYTLTVELLQRDPVAATIIDDYATSQQQLDTIYDRTGTWTHWQSGTYKQYRGEGRLDFDHDFGTQSLYVQARAQFAEAGTLRLHARGITAELTSSGQLRLLNGATVLASTTVTALPVGAPAGSSARAVLALRVRDNTARLYYSRAESYIPLALEADLAATAGTGPCGIESNAEVWIDHIYLGDGWWYQPREAIDVQIGSATLTLGRITRTGITWDTEGRFRPNADVDEHETRETEIDLDWVMEHWRPAPLQDDTGVRVRIVPTDHDVWIGRIMAVDQDDAEIVYWSDAQTIAHWAGRAEHDWDLAGVALWTLGQEDVRTWEVLAGGELPPETKRLHQ